MQNATLLSSNVRFALFAIVFAPTKDENTQNKAWTELESAINQVIEGDYALTQSVQQAQIEAAGTTVKIAQPSEYETKLAQTLREQIKVRQVNPHTLRAFIAARADRYGNFGHNLVAVTVPAAEATTLHMNHWTDLLNKVESFHGCLMGEFNTLTVSEMVMGENPINVPAVPASIVTQKTGLVQVIKERDFASLRPLFGAYMIAWATYMAHTARMIDTYATTAFQAIDTDGNVIDPAN